MSIQLSTLITHLRYLDLSILESLTEKQRKEADAYYQHLVAVVGDTEDFAQTYALTHLCFQVLREHFPPDEE
jgi:hypothetical protein